MKYLKFACFLYLFLTLPILAQNQTPGTHRYVLIPPTKILLTVAAQTNSPLQIENAKCYYDLTTGDRDYRFDVRNKSAKSIMRFTVEAITIIGTGGTLNNDWGNKKMVLLPGKVLADNVDPKQIVPLTPEIAQKLKLGAKVRLMIMLDIFNAKFADGTEYDGSQETNAFVEYFQRIGGSPVFDDL